MKGPALEARHIVDVGPSVIVLSREFPRRMHVGGGLRSEITEFSASSQKRFFMFLGQITDWKDCLFVTLTYPGMYSTNPADWKRDLQTFRRWLDHRFDGLAVVWRLEAQRRGAPHYHLLVWGAPELMYKGVQKEARAAWYRIVDSGDGRHLRRGLHCDRIRHRLAAAKYLAKELGKKLSCFGCPVGRYWGVWWKDRISWAPWERVEVEKKEWEEMRSRLADEQSRDMKVPREKWREGFTRLWRASMEPYRFFSMEHEAPPFEA